MSIFNILKRAKKEKEMPKEETQGKVEKKPVSEVKKVKEESKNLPHKASSSQKGFSYHVLIKPVVTEKAANLGVSQKYVFEVASGMNKTEIKKAIASLYKVQPVKVNIINIYGKNVRYGKTYGKTKNWKKAIVTLKKGEKIEVYHGV